MKKEAGGGRYGGAQMTGRTCGSGRGLTSEAPGVRETWGLEEKGTLVSGRGRKTHRHKAAASLALFTHELAALTRAEKETLDTEEKQPG